MVIGDTFPEADTVPYSMRRKVVYLPFYGLLESEREILTHMYVNLAWMMYEDYEYPLDRSLALVPFQRRMAISFAEYIQRREEWHSSLIRET